MKLDLEYKHNIDVWLCAHTVSGRCCSKQAVIGAKDKYAPSPSGLCLHHLNLLHEMDWDVVFIPQEITGTLRDAVIAEFYRVFPEPEPEPLVPCPVCGKQPEFKFERYICMHPNLPKITSLGTIGCAPEPLARAAWNSMRREPVVSAADAPKTLGGYPCDYCIDAVKVGCTTATEHQLRAMLARIEQEKAKPQKKRYQVWRLTGADGPSVCDGGTCYNKERAEQVLAVMRKRWGHEETYEVREFQP